MANSKIAVAYIRRSGRGQGGSLQSQLTWAQKAVEAEGLTLDVTIEELQDARANGLNRVGSVFFDDAVSGNLLRRPGVDAFREFLLRAPDERVGFVWKRDRLSRSSDVRASSAFEEELEQAGVHVIFSDGNNIEPVVYVRDQMDRRASVDENYKRNADYLFKLAEDVGRGQFDNARAGFWNGGMPGYGMVRYSLNEYTGEVALQPGRGSVVGDGYHTVVLPGQDTVSLKELDVVRRISSLYDNRFGGLKAIANLLNSEGIPSPNAGRSRKRGGVKVLVSGKWDAGAVRGVLENPIYMGLYSWGRASEGGHGRFCKESAGGIRKVRVDELHLSRKGKKIRARDRDDWLLCKPAVPFEPIVDPSVWERNYERLKQRGKKGGQRNLRRNRGHDRYPLHVVCGNCGANMSGEPHPSHGYRYKCLTYTKQGKDACSCNWVAASIVESFALKAVEDSVKSPELREALGGYVRDALVGEPEGLSDQSTERAEVANELAQLETVRRKVNAERYGEDQCKARDAEALYEELREKTDILERRLTKLTRSAPVSTPDLGQEVSKALGELDGLHAWIHAIPRDQLAQVFRAFDVKVVVQFEYREGAGRRKNFPVSAVVIFGESASPPPAPGEPHPPYRQPVECERAQSRAHPAVRKSPSVSESPLGAARGGSYRLEGESQTGDKGVLLSPRPFIWLVARQLLASKLGRCRATLGARTDTVICTETRGPGAPAPYRLLWRWLSAPSGLAIGRTGGTVR